MTMPSAPQNADRTNRPLRLAPASHGRGIDVDPPVITAHCIHVAAPAAVVWDLQTDIASWPEWQPSVRTAWRLGTGPLRRGSRFVWTTPVPASPLSPADTLLIESTVDHVERHRTLLWHGPGTGESIRVEAGVHLWSFREVDGGTLVHTEESWAGPMVEAAPELATAALDASLQAWLRHLRLAAEAVARPGRA